MSKSQAYPGYLTKELFLSKAYRELTPAAKDIFTLLAFEIRFAPSSSRSFGKSHKQTRKKVSNRDSIMLPYQQIMNELGYSRPTISSAFNELFEHGFLDITKQGGGCKGDPNVYTICEDWLDWEPGKVIRSRPKRIRKIGFQKKNKVNCTLPNKVSCTLPIHEFEG